MAKKTSAAPRSRCNSRCNRRCNSNSKTCSIYCSHLLAPKHRGRSHSPIDAHWTSSCFRRHMHPCIRNRGFPGASHPARRTQGAHFMMNNTYESDTHSMQQLHTPRNSVLLFCVSLAFPSAAVFDMFSAADYAQGCPERPRATNARHRAQDTRS